MKKMFENRTERNKFMKKIPFEHPGCNGWAIYEKKFIDAECPKNIHVAEGKFWIDDKGKKKFRPISSLKTICNEKLIDKNRIQIFCSDAPSEIRSELAELQNTGKEVCGVCVSHFYADQGA